jgi:5-methylcytosine-specific restriction endonuclease McrA
MPYGHRSARTVRLPKGWAKIRARILKRDGHACTWDTPSGRCMGPATDVDHIGDPNDHSDTNLRSLCRQHHRTRSSQQGGLAAAAKRIPRRRPPEKHPGLIA